MSEIDTITANPDWVVRNITLKTGEEVCLRHLEKGDAIPFGEFLAGLSEDTVEFYRPHGLDIETGKALCEEIGKDGALRFVAVNKEGGGEIIAYMIFLLYAREQEINRYSTYNIKLDSEVDCTFAPAVADKYQNSGIGSQFLGHTLEIIKRLNRRYVVLMGGTQVVNYRARHYYEKFGFVLMGEFMKRKPGVDMVLKLSPTAAARGY